MLRQNMSRVSVGRGRTCGGEGLMTDLQAWIICPEKSHSCWKR